MLCVLIVEGMSVVVNVMLSLMSVMSPPPALCNLSVRTDVKLCILVHVPHDHQPINVLSNLCNITYAFPTIYIADGWLERRCLANNAFLDRR